MNFFLAHGTLHPTAPFDFNKSLYFLRIFTPAKNEQVLSGNALLKAISINGQAVIVRINSIGSVTQPELEYRLISEQPISEDVKFAALDRASFFLSLYDNLRPFYDICSKDSHFTPVLRKLYGYHQIKFATPFENACWVILSQRTSFARARQMKEDLIQEFGSSIIVHGTEFRAFPEPPLLSSVQEKEIAGLLENPQKAKQLVSIARAFEEVEEEFLRHGSYETVKNWLQSLEGLDAWGAAFVLLRGLGRMEEKPIIDKRLINAASKFYGSNSGANISLIAGPYGRWQGYWSHYLRVAA